MTKTSVVATLPIESTDLNVAASATAAGIVELATNAETIAGSSDALAVTPASLQAKVASDTAKGIVELATVGEVKAGIDTDRAVTAAGVRGVMSGLKFISFDGVAAAGPCVAVGAGVGDLVLYVAGLTGGALGNASANFESTITTVQEIQQSSASNLSANDYLAVLLAVS
jgi:hypothetical protein